MKNIGKNSQVITIDVGSMSIKAVCLEFSDKGKRLLSAEEINYKTPIGNKEDEKDKESIISALKEISKNLKINRNTHVLASFFNREMQVKIIDLPQQIQSTQIEKTLNWEARKLLSPAFKDTPYTFAYKIIKNNPISAVIAVIPTSILNKYIELFKQAGIKLDGIFPEVFSSMSLRTMADIAGLPAVSVVNVGYYGTHLQIFSAGELRFYRYIPSGTSEFSTIPSSSELEVFSQKIRFSFDYFRAVSKLNQIDLLCFMGGGAAVEGVLPYEQVYFAPTRIIPVDISSGIDIANAFSGSIESAEEKQRRLLAFMPAVGIALASQENEAIKMNLLAQTLLKEKAARYDKLMSIIPIILSILILLGSLIISFVSKASFTSEINKLESEIKDLNGKIKDYKEKAEKIETIDRFKLSKKYEKVIGESIKRPHYLWALANIRTLAGENIEIKEILVKNTEEAERINLPDINNNPNNVKNLNDEPNLYLSPMYQVELSEQELPESLDGRIAIVRGIAKEMKDISKYAYDMVLCEKKDENNVKQRVLLRIISIVSRSNEQGNIEFLLKGELP